jgi:hypothetical protein
MAQVTTWTWTINSMQQWPSGNNSGYVVNVYWLLTGTDGTHIASIQGATQYPVTEATSGFTPYAQLTQDTVIGWVQASLGETGISNFQANVQGQINSMITPPVYPTSQPLPWSA